MFKSFGWGELVLILVIVLLIFGAGKLPDIGRALGKSIREFKKSREEGKEEDLPKAAQKEAEKPAQTGTK